MSISSYKDKARCPYCRTQIEVIVPSPRVHNAEVNFCTSCRKPIAVYSCRANMLQHSDRSVKAIAVENPANRNTEPWLEIVENIFTIPQEMPVPVGVSILGRHNKDSTADLRVFTSDPSMSRHHLKVIRKGDTLTVQDFESNTGTFVNGKILSRGEMVALRDGDVLTLGALSIIVHLPMTDKEFDEYPV